MSPATVPVDERFPCFNGLRAVAALLVVFHHTAFTTAFELRGVRIPFTEHVVPIGAYFAHMDIGVQIFFLISGFLLYRPMVAAAFSERRPRNLRTYARHRFLRIYPAYWVAFACIALFVGVYMPVSGGRSLFEYFFLFHLYDTGSVVVDGQRVWRALGGISQSWTLVVEVSFYIFLPLYAALLRKLGRGRGRESRFRVELAMLVVLYAISVVWRAVVYWGVPQDTAFAFLGNFWLPASLDLFALGMGLAVVRTWAEARGEPVPVLERIGRVDWLWWLLAALSFHAVSYWIGLPRGLELVYGGKAFAREFLYSLAAFCLLLPAVFGPQDRGVTRRFLQLRPIVYLGMISYGIYLWHQAFITKVHQWGGWSDNPLPNGPYLQVLIPALALTIVVASLSWYLVEAPVLRRKDRPLFDRARDAPGRPHEDVRPVSGTAPEGDRLAGFDGLRAVAAIAIVALHVTSATGAVTATGFGRYFARLDVGVTIFFVISAFLLYRPYAVSHLGGQPALTLGAYWWRRALRIFPAYWVALTAAILFFGTTALVGFWDHARHYLLVQIYVPDYGLAGIVPTWTLAVELSFYAALPVYAWVLRSITRRQTVGRRVATELAGAALLYAFGLAWHIGVVATRSTDAVSARWLPAMTDWFALGILLAVLRSASDLSAPIDTLRRIVDRYADVIVGLALVAFLAAGNVGLPVDGTSGTVGEDIAREVLFGLVGALLVAPAALGRSYRGFAIRVLDSRPAVLIGTVSYGVFLWHYQWIAKVEEWGGFDWFGSARTLSVFVIVLALSLATAAASWLLVERPLLRYKDRVGNGSTRRVAAT